MTTTARWLTCALLLIASSGCRKEGDFHPSKLGAGLYSGESLQTVERKLDMTGGGFEILEDRKPLPSDGRPPYRLLVIARKNTKVDGLSGDLELTFFNDRLMTEQFYPASPAGASEVIAGAEGVSLATGENHIAPSTRVWVGRDEQGRDYLGWIDKSLQAEQDAWIKQYGQL